MNKLDQFWTNLNLPEFSGFEGQYVDEFRPEMVFIREDGRFECTLCRSILCQMSVARTHVIQIHVAPEYFKCKICHAAVKHRMSLSQHLNRKHHIKKTNKSIIQNTFLKIRKVWNLYIQRNKKYMRPIWRNLDQFKQVQTNLNKLRQIWTISDKFKFAWIFRFWRSIRGWISSWNGAH